MRLQCSQHLYSIGHLNLEVDPSTQRPVQWLDVPARGMLLLKHELRVPPFQAGKRRAVTTKSHAEPGCKIKLQRLLKVRNRKFWYERVPVLIFFHARYTGTKNLCNPTFDIRGVQGRQPLDALSMEASGAAFNQAPSLACF